MKVITTIILLAFTVILFSLLLVFLFKVVSDFRKKILPGKKDLSGKGKSRTDIL